MMQPDDDRRERDLRDLDSLISRLPASPQIRRSAGSRDFVVLVPIVRSGGSYHLLYEKRAEGIRQAGEICFPGGRAEEGDTSLEETAVRETVEELGVSRDAVSTLGRLDGVLTHWGGVIEVIVGTIDEGALRSAVVNPNEVESTFLVSFAELLRRPAERYVLRVEVQPEFLDEEGRRHLLFPAKELGLPPRYWKPWAGPAHSVYVYRHGNETIWGITAEITRRLLEHVD
jgi:8-oxo-dGTP pyrophosphatase MutT (NUDIX family)